MTFFWFARHSENRAPAKLISRFFGLDEANARLEAVVGLAALLVLAEQALHAAVQALQHLARLVARSALRSMRSSRPQAIKVMNAPGTPCPVQSPTMTA